MYVHTIDVRAAANAAIYQLLRQAIGASSALSHLLLLIRSQIDQEVRPDVSDQGSSTQIGTLPFGVTDEPGAWPRG
jgi:hypothetical protein